MDETRIWASYERKLRINNRSEETIRVYRVSFKALSDWSSSSLDALTALDLGEFFDHRATSLKASTVARDHRNLRAFFAWLMEEEWIARNPFKKVKVPEPEVTYPRVLEEAELKALFSACRGPRINDRRDEAMIRLMSEVGGPRRGEMLGMKVADIDFGHDLVTLKGKTGQRAIPYGNKTGVSLERYLRMRDNHRCSDLPGLWLSQQGAMTLSVPREILNRRSEKAGIGHIHPHILRHTAAHRAMEAGISSLDLQSLFGWSGERMLKVYGRATRAVRAQNVARRAGLGDKF
jgi:site-specific recombinase XerD